MKNIVGTVVTVLILAFLTGVVIVYGGFIDVSADKINSEAKVWLLRTILRESVERAASDLEAPPLDGRERLVSGIVAFDDMCVSCHGAPGVDAMSFAQHMNPEPPRLGKVAPIWTAEELFWITSHGIEATGMPAWGVTHDEEVLWNFVAIIEQLPDMSAQEYQALLQEGEEAGGRHGHGGSGNGHGHGDGGTGDDQEDAAADPTPDAAPAPDDQHGHSGHTH